MHQRRAGLTDKHRDTAEDRISNFFQAVSDIKSLNSNFLASCKSFKFYFKHIFYIYLNYLNHPAHFSATTPTTTEFVPAKLKVEYRKCGKLMAQHTTGNQI